ncbi:hypothetical protein Dsin_010257 [Dipteronia sinensis]|uniref:Neprosin PEP catalytic domain-containing protein n=1 Tax=Dipteronia sinensis TaxID=43782 RepID=A0AAE0ASD3_9ROSI|nr:hypothetical protein Dsin_010257 [Dipteronia sinensis]
MRERRRRPVTKARVWRLESVSKTTKDLDELLIDSSPQNTEEYECVDIYKQPAFNNILLKNHKIQMNPSFMPRVIKRNGELLFSSKIPSEGCPMGMVPIQKTQVDNLTDLNSISKLHLGNIQPLSTAAPGRHFAAHYIEGPIFHGAQAGISLYNPPVKMNQVSMSQIWIENGPPAELNSIQVGWAVHPRIYGDTRTRATAYWTADGSKKTGCYNVLCPGFVQVHPRYRLGQAYGAISVIGGKQYITQPLVFLDKKSGNWWLAYDNGNIVGYWPKELFTHLREGATFVQYGGWTFNSPDGVSPPMGNGRFPNGYFRNSSFFSQMKMVDTSNVLVDIDDKRSGRLVDSANCYNQNYWKYQGSVLGKCMTFGGPGGTCGI